MLNKYYLLYAISAIPSFTTEQRKVVCTGIYGAYFFACTEEHRNKQLNDKQVNQIVTSCETKARNFTVQLDICEDAVFIKE